MPFNAPVYVYNFNGVDLPGYGQLERFDLRAKAGHDDIVNRNGGILWTNGLAVRPITINLNIYSRLTSGSGIDHLNDLKDQIRDALRVCARVKTPAQLFLGDTDRYLTAVFTGFDSAFSSADGRRGSYGLNFDAQPLFESTTLQTDSVAADGTLELAMVDTAETYPVFIIDAGITNAVLTGPDGRTITFVRGAVVGDVRIDCGTFRIETVADEASVASTVEEVNIGFSYEGTGNFTVTVSGFAGTGNITMQMRARYER